MRPFVVLVVPLLACTFDASGFGDPPELGSDAGVGVPETTTGSPMPEPTVTAGETETTTGLGVSGTTTGGTTSDPTTGPDPTTDVDPSTTTTTGPESTGPDETTMAPCEMVELHPDADGDTFGDANATMMVCVGAPGFVEDGTDCDDASVDIHPGANEQCNDRDDDCDGVLNEFDTNANKTECGDCKYKVRNGRLYYFCDTGLTWSDARAYCQVYGLDLAVDNDDPEHEFLWDEAEYDSGMWWIGGNDIETEGMYKWVDFGDISKDDPRWADGQPNNQGGGQNVDCIGIIADGIPYINDGFGSPPEIMKQWVDHSCAWERPFICEGTAP